MNRKTTSLLIDEENDDQRKYYNISEFFPQDFKLNQLFEHPFAFFLIKNFSSSKTLGLIEKPTAFEIGIILDGFLSKIGIFLNRIKRNFYRF